jgi:excisionase family DNA binding protein
MKHEKDYFTTEELLEYLQINIRTIYRMIRAGKLPAYRVGRQWRFRKRDLDIWLAQQRQGDAGGQTAERPRVLVVDDEEMVREMVVKLLSNSDWEVVTAPDGASALNLLRATEYDLLVTDLKMPGMDGLSMIRQARQEVTELPVIIITAHSTEASAIEALNMGVSGYLLKPFRGQRFLSIAAKLLGEPEPPEMPIEAEH